MYSADCAIPPQWLTAARGDGAEQRGERRLLLAVLEDAIHCFQKNIFAGDNQGRRLFREAEQWIMSEDDAPYSFEHICDVLHFDAQYLRRGLRRWRTREVANATRHVAPALRRESA